jgi:butyrate kinase
MPSSAQTRAIDASRAAIEEINAFMTRGTPLKPYLRAAICRDEERAMRLASEVIRKNNLMPEIMKKIEDEVPLGLFQNDEQKIDEWIGHHGISGATDSERMYLLMATDRWKREAVTHNA